MKWFYFYTEYEDVDNYKLDVIEADEQARPALYGVFGEIYDAIGKLGRWPKGSVFRQEFMEMMLASIDLKVERLDIGFPFWVMFYQDGIVKYLNHFENKEDALDWVEDNYEDASYFVFSREDLLHIQQRLPELL